MGSVFALALIHHLAISNNVPLARLADFFAELCQWLIIEWVPKSDSQVQKMMRTRKDIFEKYTREGFESAFGTRFHIREVRRMSENLNGGYTCWRKRNSPFVRWRFDQ